MKVSLVVTSLYSQGAEYVVAVLARGFAAAGNKVDVVVSALNVVLSSTLKDRKPFELGEGVSVITLPHVRARHNVLALRRYIKQTKPDVVLNNAGPFMPALALANLSLPRSSRTKIVHVEHLGGIGLDALGNPVIPKLTLGRRFYNALLGTYDSVFVVSQGTKDAVHRVSGYPLDKMHVVYNPAVDDTSMRKMMLPPSHPWLRSKEVPVIVAAGAFNPLKNYELLIRAFDKVRRDKSCRLIIFGEGPLRPEYEKLVLELGVGELVSLPGYTDQLPAEIKAASAFVVSSNVESFSIVLVEALAAGTPVISTDAPYGPPEILEGGKYGILVRRGDVDSMAEGMMKVLSGNGIKAPNVAYERFSIANVVRNYEHALARIGVR